jgi:hypothetical protein
MNLQEQISRIKTMMRLNESQSFTKHLELGKTHDEVEKLQDELDMETTGEFDSETEDCVKEFQTFTDINVDGIVGPETRTKLNDLVDGKIERWKGCGRTVKDMPKTPSSVEAPTNKDIVGSEWKSCKAWYGKGGLSKWGDKVKVQKSSSGFLVSYSGPASGIAIAHAHNGGDTVHQLFNILICEINPFLFKGGLKPDIEGIRFKTGSSGGNSKLEILVPLKSTDGTYQLDRRGGWGHDPGPGKMSRKCSSVNKQDKECIGPVTKVVQGPFGKITEYFITHEI